MTSVSNSALPCALQSCGTELCKAVGPSISNTFFSVTTGTLLSYLAGNAMGSKRLGTGLAAFIFSWKIGSVAQEAFFENIGSNKALCQACFDFTLSKTCIKNITSDIADELQVTLCNAVATKAITYTPILANLLATTARVTALYSGNLAAWNYSNSSTCFTILSTLLAVGAISYPIFTRATAEATCFKSLKSILSST